jgi:hypothetical protein
MWGLRWFTTSFNAGKHVAGSQGVRLEDADCGKGVAM